MKSTREIRRQAGRLYRACVVDGLLDDSRVRRTVQQLVTFKPRGFLNILLLFRRLVQLDLARRSASVESALRVPPEMQTDIEKRLAELYGAGVTTSFSENRALIAGLRIKVGSDVYDGTVDGRLNAIEQSFQ